MQISSVVADEVRRLFTPLDAELVLAEFAETEFPLIANNGERVCLAILYRSQGDLSRFDRELRQAKTDWRDTLAAGG